MNANSQAGPTSSQGSRCSNTEKDKLLMQNFDIHKFSFDNIKRSSGCNFALQKIKIMQGMHILQCSENHDIHFKCTILHTHKIMENCR